MESRFHTLLKVKVLALREEKVRLIVEGGIAPETYQAEVHYVRALTDVLALCEDTEREFGL